MAYKSLACRVEEGTSVYEHTFQNDGVGVEVAFMAGNIPEDIKDTPLNLHVVRDFKLLVASGGCMFIISMIPR
jgi:hypothetical protein